MAELSEQDIVMHPLPNREYDLVVLFGVIHHVPSQARRFALMRELAQSVAKGACWRSPRGGSMRTPPCVSGWWNGKPLGSARTGIT
ncbi:MAG UNVERIFIED_CONTAM: class I SAM-dependent methyltransferase [Anaerolineae bacterium]